MTTVKAHGAPANHVALPTLTRADWDARTRWWRPETGIERRCPTCGSGLSNEPPQAQRYGRVFCLLGCTRQVAWVSSVGWTS